MASGNVTFARLNCLEKGYGAKVLDARKVGDRILIEIEEPYVVTSHPVISTRYVELDLPLSQCTGGEQGHFSCSATNGVWRAGPQRLELRDYAYGNISFISEPDQTDGRESGTTFTLAVDGGDVSPSLRDTWIFTTRLTGDSAFHTFCQVDGKKP